jgi:hypothetical protein
MVAKPSYSSSSATTAAGAATKDGWTIRTMRAGNTYRPVTMASKTFAKTDEFKVFAGACESLGRALSAEGDMTHASLVQQCDRRCHTIFNYAKTCPRECSSILSQETMNMIDTYSPEDDEWTNISGQDTLKIKIRPQGGSLVVDVLMCPLLGL